MIIVLVIIGFAIGIPLMLKSDDHHTKWKKQNPDKAWYPGTIGSNFAIVILGVAMTGFLYLMSMDGSSLSLVRMEVNCQDGTRAQTHVHDSVVDDMKELREKGCVWVDDKGNLIQFDQTTGDTISVDPITGEKVEEQK